MIQRFFQSGAWLPFFREHSGQESARREPYLWSEEVQDNLRATIKRRYKHLPYWYTVFYEHIRNGDPVIRPLWYDYPNELLLFDLDSQLLVESNILVKPIDEPGVATTLVYFPGGEDLLWFEADLQSPYPQYPGIGFTEVPVTIDKVSDNIFFRLYIKQMSCRFPLSTKKEVLFLLSLWKSQARQI